MTDICGEIAEDLPFELNARNICGLYILDDGVDRDLDDVWKNILARMDFVIVQSYAMTDLAKSAHIVLPGLAPFEREGTITNDLGRVQWLRPSLPIQGEAKPDWEILALVMKEMHPEQQPMQDISQVMKEMGAKFPDYKGLSFFRLGSTGISLNGRHEA
jgi:predicted molibdopterin-dependent oxidoreductase YjgC